MPRSGLPTSDSKLRRDVLKEELEKSMASGVNGRLCEEGERERPKSI